MNISRTLVRLKKVLWMFIFLVLLHSIVDAFISVNIKQFLSTGCDMTQSKQIDHVLILLQCSFGLLMLFVPLTIERKTSIRFPTALHLLFYLFLFCSIYLGEVQNFYYLIPYWDSLLHAGSGIVLALLGYELISILNKKNDVEHSYSAFYCSLFAFTFALAMGTLWEIYEFIFDGLFFLNMQKYALESGALLVGRAALFDTMKDLIIDAVSALLLVTMNYYIIRKKMASLSLQQKSIPKETKIVTFTSEPSVIHQESPESTTVEKNKEAI